MTVPLKKVSPKEIRELFNSGGYAQKVQAGELSTKTLREGHPSPSSSGEPPCTRSQIIAYLDKRGRKVAIVHQYLRKDGKLGASGEPDPKKLFHNGTLHVVR